MSAKMIDVFGIARREGVKATWTLKAGTRKECHKLVHRAERHAADMEVKKTAAESFEEIHEVNLAIVAANRPVILVEGVKNGKRMVKVLRRAHANLAFTMPSDRSLDQARKNASYYHCADPISGVDVFQDIDGFIEDKWMNRFGKADY